MLNAAQVSRWFGQRAGRQPGAIQLFCLPHAGAGTSPYRRWPGRLPPAVEAIPVRLPGREGRFSEAPARSAAELVALMLDPLLDWAGERFALFGHSMGALLAFELAHAVTNRNRPPVHVFVSGYAAPHLPPRKKVAAHTLPDEALLDHIAGMNGTPAGVPDVPEMMRLLLPVLRADVELCETYEYMPRLALPVPVTAFGGADDPHASGMELDAWRELTTGDFRRHIFPGGHFYLLERPELVVDSVAATLLGPSAEMPARKLATTAGLDDTVLASASSSARVDTPDSAGGFPCP